MRDMLSTGMTWLRGQRKAHMAGMVTYTRANDSVSLAASIGRSVFTMPDESGFEVEIVMRDFLITTADLILVGSVTLPEVGDQITQAGYTFEVMRPGPNVSEWDYADAAYRGTLRVHTKEVAAP